MKIEEAILSALPRSNSFSLSCAALGTCDICGILTRNLHQQCSKMEQKHHTPTLSTNLLIT